MFTDPEKGVIYIYIYIKVRYIQFKYATFTDVVHNIFTIFLQQILSSRLLLVVIVEAKK